MSIPATDDRTRRRSTAAQGLPRAVRVEPLGAEIIVRPGETLIDAAWREGYEWPTTCWGQAQCMQCHVIVLEGADNLSNTDREEANALRLGLPTIGRDSGRLRLACRVEVHGPAVVLKHGVRRR